MELWMTTGLLAGKLGRIAERQGIDDDASLVSELGNVMGITADVAEKILERAAAAVLPDGSAQMLQQAMLLLGDLDKLSSSYAAVREKMNSGGRTVGRQVQEITGLLSNSLAPCLSRISEMMRSGEGVSPEDAEEWASSLPLSGVSQVICMFGYGDGAYYEALRRHASPDSYIIVYEPEHDALQDLREQLILHVDYYMLEQLAVCAHPMYDRIYATEYADFIHAINENRERVLVNRNTMMRFREDAPRNVLRNLHMLREANLVTDLAQILPVDVPVIIVSAGPSLDKNIDLLKKAKGHALIFCVDTAMKYLMARDIIPDLGITVEPIKPMANYEDDRCFDVPHVFDCESNPLIVRRNRQRKFIYNCRDYMRRLLEKDHREVPIGVASGGSVATAAFAICYQLGIRTIIMIGQDLAYDGEATHAGGVESAGINGDIGTEMVEGALGGMVRTRSDWSGYRRWFESGIRLARETGRELTVIDATEGGALIRGTEVMTFAEAIDRYCSVDYDFAGELDKLPLMLDDAGCDRMLELIKCSFDELETVRAHANLAVGRCAALYNKGMIRFKNTPPGNPNVTEAELKLALRDCTAYRCQCEKAMLYPLINNYAVCGVVDEINRVRMDERDNLRELKQQEIAFNAIAEACDYFESLRGEARFRA